MLENDLSPSIENKTIYLKDYAPPNYWIKHSVLDFQLAQTTKVTSTISVERNGEHNENLKLDGEKIQLESIALIRV